MSALAGFGLTPGLAMLWSQMLVALALAPGLLYAAHTRFPNGVAAVYVAVALLLVLGLSHGDISARVSFSMHYNRWCWALALLAVPLACLDGGGRRGIIDGVLIGLALSAMALIKMTFFAAFLPVIAAGLVLRQAFGSACTAAVTGGGIAILVTFAYGAGFWGAYYSDLAAVANAPFRSIPGDSLAGNIIFPEFMPGTLLAFAGYFVLRRGGDGIGAIVLLLLAAGGIYATFQSFDNPPFWFAVAGVFLLARADVVTRMIGGAFLVLIAPLVLNLAVTILWHSSLARAGGSKLVAARPVGIQVAPGRIDRFDVPPAFLAASGETRGLNGAPLPDCNVRDGLAIWYNALAQDVAASGIPAEAGILVADTIGSVWLAGIGQPPRADQTALGGASAPWHYGGAPGSSAANYVVVPTCVTDLARRADILKTLRAGGQSFETVHEGRLSQIYRINR